MFSRVRRAIARVVWRIISFLPFIRNWFLKYHFSRTKQYFLIKSGDPVRYGAVWLAINDIERHAIPGAFAEAGVYRGDLSHFVNSAAPTKKLYLFDTFEGFPKQSLKGKTDNRFSDTSLESVKAKFPKINNVIIRKGFFPETAQDLQAESFSFVMIDFDLYDSTLAALEFFYPRMTRGGYIFLHDYNSSESDYGVSKATNLFMNDKVEKIICIPDVCGSAVIRKN